MLGCCGASLVVPEQVFGMDFDFASARSTGVRDRPSLTYWLIVQGTLTQNSNASLVT
jgi:hypothetical protein